MTRKLLILLPLLLHLSLLLPIAEAAAVSSDWNTVTPTAPWTAVFRASTLAVASGPLAGLWHIGGADSNGILIGDVWRSQDGGITWARLAADLAVLRVAGAQLYTTNWLGTERLFLTSGYDGSGGSPDGFQTPRNVFYYSNDGVAWQSGGSSLSSGQYRWGAVVLKIEASNAFILIGGIDENGAYPTSVFSTIGAGSNDPASFVDTFNNIPQGGGVGGCAAVFDGKIFYMGGWTVDQVDAFELVTYTTDAVSVAWTTEPSAYAIQPRCFFGCAVHRNLLYLVGGQNGGTGSHDYLSDVRTIAGFGQASVAAGTLPDGNHASGPLVTSSPTVMYFFQEITSGTVFDAVLRYSVLGCTSSPCQNGATCNELEDAFSCTCPSGYRGTLCQTFNECASSPCSNGGSCYTSQGVSGYVCTCPPGYSGSRCSSDVNECSSIPCMNSGSCYTNNGPNGFVCTCLPGYSGRLCQTRVDECSSSPCFNGASCVANAGCGPTSQLNNVRYTGHFQNANSSLLPAGALGEGSRLQTTADGVIVIVQLNADKRFDTFNWGSLDVWDSHATGNHVFTHNLQAWPPSGGAYCGLSTSEWSLGRDGRRVFAYTYPSNSDLRPDCGVFVWKFNNRTRFFEFEQNGLFPSGHPALFTATTTGVVACGNSERFFINRHQAIYEFGLVNNNWTNIFTEIPAFNHIKYNVQAFSAVNSFYWYASLDCLTLVVADQADNTTGTRADGAVLAYTRTSINVPLSPAQKFLPPYPVEGVFYKLGTFLAVSASGNTIAMAGNVALTASAAQRAMPQGFLVWRRDPSVNASVWYPLQAPTVSNYLGSQYGIYFYCENITQTAVFPGSLTISDDDRVIYATATADGYPAPLASREHALCIFEYSAGTYRQFIPKRTRPTDLSSAFAVAGQTTADGRQFFGTSGVVAAGSLVAGPIVGVYKWAADCSDGETGYTCACASGFSGIYCATNIDECVSSPCQNGGTCYDSANGYACACPDGFPGATCQTQIDPCACSPCLHGGTCYSGVSSYACACMPGYSGSQCQTDIDECVSSPCLNAGSCFTNQGINGLVCSCLPGFSGNRCQTDVDECASSPCLFGGTCTQNVPGSPSAYTCACVPWYSGTICQTAAGECTSLPCHNGGTCTQSSATGYTCACTPGFSGLLCQTDIDECASSPCGNGGSCYTTPSPGYLCTCAPGYSGLTCLTDINECLSAPCMNSGSCYTNQGINNWVCSCLPGWSGHICQTQISECASAPCGNGGTCRENTGCGPASRLSGLLYTERLQNVNVSQFAAGRFQEGTSHRVSADGTTIMVMLGTDPRWSWTSLAISTIDVYDSLLTGTHLFAQNIVPISGPTSHGSNFVCGFGDYWSLAADGILLVATTDTGQTYNADLNCGVMVWRRNVQTRAYVFEQLGLQPGPLHSGYDDSLFMLGLTVCGNSSLSRFFLLWSSAVYEYGAVNGNWSVFNRDLTIPPNQHLGSIIPIASATTQLMASDDCRTLMIGDAADNKINTATTIGAVHLFDREDIDQPLAYAQKLTPAASPVFPGPAIVPQLFGKAAALSGTGDTVVVAGDMSRTSDEALTLPQGFMVFRRDRSVNRTLWNTLAAPAVSGYTGNQYGHYFYCEGLTTNAGFATKLAVSGNDAVIHATAAIDGYPGTGLQALCTFEYTNGLSTYVQYHSKITTPIPGLTTWALNPVTTYDGHMVVGAGSPSTLQSGVYIWNATCSTDDVIGYTCACASGFSGVSCQIDIACASSPCLNGGQCATNQALNAYVCSCAQGYSGRACETDIDECASTPCANGGSCQTNQAVNGYVCTCAAGFSGIHCGTDINECASAPCQNGGACYTNQGANGYVCQCGPGFSGVRCQTDIDECGSVPCQNGGSCYQSSPTMYATSLYIFALLYPC